MRINVTFWQPYSSQINRRLNQPAINIYTDKDSGKPKGDATLSYDEPSCARAAVEHFNGESLTVQLCITHTHVHQRRPDLLTNYFQRFLLNVSGHY